MPRDDINYKVAIAAGAKELAAGQLRKAEEQFRFAAKRCPECGGGYRGLAKVFVELEDRTTALDILREGAQTVTRAGNRAEAIELLRDAVRLAPEDRALHRRYAAALANAGNERGAVEEYDRFVSAALARGDIERARLEIGYARETLGILPAISAIEQRVARHAPTAPPPRKAAPFTIAPIRVPSQPSAPPVQQFVSGAAPASKEHALELEARAQVLLAQCDPLAPAAALEAARALLFHGLEHAAGDLLLQLVGSGITDRDAQRLLIDVVKTIGNGQIARDKCVLLAHALRLDGQVDAAREVERLAAV